MSLDLDAYLERIGYQGSLQPSIQTLLALHLAHTTHVPFENLDVLLGRPIRLDLEGLQAKLVRDRRGGYCFEQNLLFAAVLEHLGFRLDRLAARVRYRTDHVLPRTHALLRVEAGGQDWLADVGFGAEGLLLPVPLILEQECEQFAWRFRLREDDGYHVLQSGLGTGWQDLYVFSHEPQHLVDFEVANYYVSTHPSSIFVKMLTAQRVTPEARHVLRNREYGIETSGQRTTRTIADDELGGILSEVFGLVFPPGTRFPQRGE